MRDPSTVPLNFTKSINLALSVRGITAMQQAEPNVPEGERKLLDHVLAATIPMRGRMIHGKKAGGELYEEPQDYDVHGRVSFNLFLLNKFSSAINEMSKKNDGKKKRKKEFIMTYFPLPRPFSPSTGAA